MLHLLSKQSAVFALRSSLPTLDKEGLLEVIAHTPAPPQSRAADSALVIAYFAHRLLLTALVEGTQLDIQV
jgi:hypothetical protein